MPTPVKKWLASYLRGRRASTIFRDKKSLATAIHAGVPQGSIISPALFNAYIRDLPEPPPGIHIISYADDITIICSGPDVDTLVSTLNSYLDTLSNFLASRSLIIFEAKFTVTLFTTHRAQLREHPQVRINNSVVPLTYNPKILGVTFDRELNFNTHTQNVAANVNKRNNVLRALSGTSWGQTQENLIHTYKSIGRSIINYAAPVYTPNLNSEKEINKLQVAQNSALRTATGCHKMTSIDHLHQTTKLLPVKAHNELLSCQYLANCYSDNHPCNFLTNLPPRHRPMRHTLSSKFNDTVVTGRNTLPPDSSTKRLLSKIHTKLVDDCISTYDNNRVLSAQPPDISAAELSLPRHQRTFLNQLRSGFCSKLNSFKSRINPHITNSCPNCGNTPHDVNHLFNCPSNPTTLQPIHLWTDPVKVMSFLNT